MPIGIVAFNTAGTMADAVKTGVWDVAFLGAELQRASEISFTAAYAEIESTYLAPAGSPLRTIADVDREGVRIAVSAKSAYELYLAAPSNEPGCNACPESLDRSNYSPPRNWMLSRASGLC